VSPKRGERVAPPPGPGEWDIRFQASEAAKGWEELCQQAPGNTLAAWLIMRRNPVPPMDSERHHRLRRELATGVRAGRSLDRWQIEVTGAGRIWYLVDPEAGTIWVEHAGPGHPKATE
jgi:hypothetical protein